MAGKQRFRWSHRNDELLIREMFTYSTCTPKCWGNLFFLLQEANAENSIALPRNGFITMAKFFPEPNRQL